MSELRRVIPEEVVHEQQEQVRQLIGDDAYHKLVDNRWTVCKRSDIENIVALVGLGSMDWREAFKFLGVGL